MWPFRRRPAGEISLDDLRDLVETSPVKRYVNLLLLDLGGSDEGASCTLSKSRSLPSLTGYKWEEELPPFEKVRNRLKVMADLDPVTFQEPVKGHFKMQIGARPCIAHVDFDDGADDPTVNLRLEWTERHGESAVTSC